MYNEFFESPVGLLNIVASDKGVKKISFVRLKTVNHPNDITQQCISELSHYFLNPKTVFHTPTDIDDMGTEFQQKVWRLLSQIPLSQTKSYADISAELNSGKSYRAVGNANNKNPLPIMIPCHRVVNKNGELGGYAGGIKAKKWLLDHETCLKEVNS